MEYVWHSLSQALWIYAYCLFCLKKSWNLRYSLSKSTSTGQTFQEISATAKCWFIIQVLNYTWSVKSYVGHFGPWVRDMCSTWRQGHKQGAVGVLATGRGRGMCEWPLSPWTLQWLFIQPVPWIATNDSFAL